MSSPVDHAVITWDMARPKLRQDLQFHFQIVEGRPTYVLEDRSNRAYHQIGVPEYRFLRSLNGTKPAAKLLAECSMGKDALTESEVESLLRWAIDNHLLQSARADQADRRMAHAEDRAPKAKQTLMRFFFLKLPLGSPEMFLRPFTRWLSWTLEPWAMVLALFALIYGIYLVATNFTVLMESSTRALLPQNWLWFMGATVVLKIVHELWHGIATQKFGGVVPEWGLQVILWISPLTYVDATSSWSFPNRWQRITVAAAGMYVELLIAVVAMHVWTLSDPGALREVAFNVVISASMVTLIFNANPLMRFDGYYIMSDLLDVRNMAQKGQQAFSWVNRRVFFGAKNPPIATALRKRFLLLLTYGGLAWFWRILVSVGLLALAANLFHGMGLVALLLAGIPFLASLLHSLAAFFNPSAIAGKIPWKSASWRIGIALLLVATALLWIPINPTAAGLAVIEYPGKAILRAETPGFAATFHCQDGDQVQQGQCLVTLVNEDESTKLQLLESQLKLSEAQSRILYLRGHLDDWQTEQLKTDGLREKVAVQQKRAKALEIHAPMAGRVHAPGQRHQIGTYFETGAPLMTLIPPQPPQVLISMRQPDFQRVSDELATDPKPFRLRLQGRPGEFVSELERTESKATLAIPNAVLASSAGGPLAVRGISQRETATLEEGLARGANRSESLTYYDSIRPEAQRENMELLQPRFTVYATVQANTDLREGEWGYAHYEGGTSEALGLWLYRVVSSYLERSFLSAAGA